MALREDLTIEVGEIYTDVMAELEGDAIELKLLRQSPTADVFDVLEVITSKWFFEYSDVRQNFLLQIAESETMLNASMILATHVSINDVIYVIRTADTVPPQGTDVTWKIFCDRFIGRANYSSLY